jgi:hypothetical protein
MEEPFKERIEKWVKEESTLDGMGNPASFSRITIGDVKPHIVKEVCPPFHGQSEWGSN